MIWNLGRGITLLCILSLSVFSCGSNSNKDENYPHVPQRLIRFFDATLFQDKSNTVDFVPHPMKVNGKTVPFRFYIEELGSITPMSSDYLDNIVRVGSFGGRIMAPRRSNKPERIKSVRVFGLHDQSEAELRLSYESYREFMEQKPNISFEDFKQIDFSDTCFVQLENTSVGRRVFSAILYNQSDSVPPSYKKRVAACYYGSYFVLMGIWPFPPKEMEELVIPLGPTMPEHKDTEYVYNTQLNSFIQDPFYHEKVYVGMGRNEFMEMLDLMYADKAEMSQEY